MRRKQYIETFEGEKDSRSRKSLVNQTHHSGCSLRNASASILNKNLLSNYFVQGTVLENLGASKMKWMWVQATNQ